MTLPTSRTSWRKSSYSGNGGANCVEVAFEGPCALLRDSKNPKLILMFDATAAGMFRDAVKGGSLGA